MLLNEILGIKLYEMETSRSSSSHSESDVDIVLTILTLLSNQIGDRGNPSLKTSVVLDKIRSVPQLQNYTKDNLVELYTEYQDSFKNVINNITPDIITFNTGDQSKVEQPKIDTSQDPTIAKQVVNNMATSALKRRQK
jgi:hypothetical protein